MEPGRVIRLKIGKSLLAKKLAKTTRRKSYSHIGLVKKIGIVWDASDISGFSHISKFFQKMNERNIDVRIIGYFPDKTLPDQYTAIRYFSCIKRDELSFFYLPLSNDASGFIKTKFDILIDVNFKNVLPLQFLSAMSVASLKVGPAGSESNNVFDLMIDMKSNPDTSAYLDQVILYLEMIHESQSQKVESVY